MYGNQADGSAKIHFFFSVSTFTDIDSFAIIAFDTVEAGEWLSYFLVGRCSSLNFLLLATRAIQGIDGLVLPGYDTPMRVRVSFTDPPKVAAQPSPPLRPIATQVYAPSWSRRTRSHLNHVYITECTRVSCSGSVRTFDPCQFIQRDDIGARPM
jgi:hypothetical protein